MCFDPFRDHVNKNLEMWKLYADEIEVYLKRQIKIGEEAGVKHSVQCDIRNLSKHVLFYT